MRHCDSLIHIHLDDINSTQDYLKSLLKERSGEEDYLVSCNIQKSGHGRGAKNWQGYAGGLYFSFNMSPHIVPTLTTLELACLIADYFEQKFKLSLKLKWPNDLLFEDQKCAGILIDHIENQYIAGIGINLWKPQTDFSFTSLLNNTYQMEDKKSFICDIYQYIQQNRINNAAAVKNNWLQRCVHLNRKITLIDTHNQKNVVFKEIGDYGEAIVEEDLVLKKYFSASIVL
jgi:BirA family biotin operon repressor/biotin-[acetyl-CoA-carboxylase] ligase